MVCIHLGYGLSSLHFFLSCNRFPMSRLVFCFFPYFVFLLLCVLLSSKCCSVRCHGKIPIRNNLVLSEMLNTRLMYCSTAWSGFCSAADRTRLDAFLRRCQRLGYCSSDTPTVTEMIEKADEKLFDHVLSNNNHVLQQHLPERPSTQYNTRTQAHNKTLITKTTDLNDRDFLI